LNEVLEQYHEEEELYNMMQNELDEKKQELEKYQEEINKSKSGTDSMKTKRREVKEQLSSITKKFEEVKKEGGQPSALSSGNITPIGSITASPQLSAVTEQPKMDSPVVAPAKKEAPPIPRKDSKPVSPPASQTSIQPSPFGNDDFGSSNFGAPVKTESKTEASPGFDSFGSHAFDSNFDSFGQQDTFGSNTFGATSSFGTSPNPTTTTTQNKASPVVPAKPKLPPKKPTEDDPFQFSTDLSASSEIAKDAFGAPVTNKPAANNNFGFGSDNFGFTDNFGQSDFGAPQTTQQPAQPPPKPISFDGSNFAFPTNLADFDTGKDSFG